MIGSLLPCPFCGNTEPYFVRLGDSKQSSIIACGYCGCRMEANEVDTHNGSAWNRRVDPTGEQNKDSE
jgi:Lar family restriction alleviation protein